MSGQKNLKIARTQYFDIIYPEGSELSANIIYEKGDEVYELLAEEYKLEYKFRLPVVFSPAQDEFNAYFSSGPFNHIVMYDTVCQESMAVFTESVLNTFRHELTHAITYNLRNEGLYKADKILGDVYNPALLTITIAGAEGATVSGESENGEGRLNDDWSLHLVRQAKVDGKFPNAPSIQGARDIYPYATQSYMFGGAFSAWLQKKYGMEKYAEFWYRCVNFQNITYFTCFKSVYGIKLKQAWKEFYDSIEVPEIAKNPEEAEGVSKSLFSKKLSNYYSITSCKDKTVFYDLYSRKINVIKNGKKHLLYKSPYTERLSLSKDGRFLAESYQSQNKAVPINRVRIYDFEHRSFITVPDQRLRDASIIKDKDDYFLCAVYTYSSLCCLKLYKLDIQKNRIKSLTQVYEKKLEENQQIFSIEGTCNGQAYYILKDGLKFSIQRFNVESFAIENIKLPEENLRIRYLNCYENEETGERKVSFSYVKAGSFPRLAVFLPAENKCLLQKNDLSGGIYHPVITDDGKILYAAHFYKGSRLYNLEISEIEFEEAAVLTENVPSLQESQEEKLPEELKILGESEKFSAFKYTFKGPHGVFVPTSNVFTYRNESISELSSYQFAVGITYVSSTPWTNPIWWVSVGYEYLLNSWAAGAGISGGSETELFSYNASSQVEFDTKGYKQAYGELKLSSKIPLYDTVYLAFSNESQVLEGRQSYDIDYYYEKADKDSKNLQDLFKNLFACVPAGKQQYFYGSNSFFAGIGNITKSGPGYFDYSGIQAGASLSDTFLSYTDDFDNNQSFNNISFEVLLKNSLIRPITIEAVLYPNDSYIIGGMAKIVLFNVEIQKAADFVPFLYFNRFTVSSYYFAAFEDYVRSWAVKDTGKYFSHIKDGSADYRDELALTLNLDLTPNIGGLARSDFKMGLCWNFAYRFNPGENQKQFAVSPGLDMALSF